MNTKPSLARTRIFTSAGLSLALSVAACAPLAAPGAAGVDATAQPQGYPGDLQLTPPQWPAGLNPIVTAQPDERLQVGEFQEQAGPESARFAYTVRTEPFRIEGLDYDTTQLILSLGGKDIVLGDPYGYSYIQDQSADWVVWRYVLIAWEAGSAMQTGLYATRVTSGETIPVALGQDVYDAKIGDELVVYVDAMGYKGVQEAQGATPLVTLPLYAFDLRTGTTTQLSKLIPLLRGRTANRYYAGSNERAVWTEWDATSQTYGLVQHDFSDGSSKPMDIKVLLPSHLSLAGDYLVWKDIYWHGYSFSMQSGFTLPYAPEQHLYNPGVTVRAVEGGLEWRVPGETPEDAVYYFATIVTK